MPDPMICSVCGAELPADAPGGLCPACLLRAGRDSDPSQRTAAESAFTPPSVAELQSLLPNLEIIELIGQGGMGAVYKARQSALDRFVALKILPPAVSPAFTDRFQREAKLLAKLSHPGIVTVYEFGQTSDHYYIVMEFVDGVNLRQAQSAGKLQPAEALAIVPKICEALQYAHEAGIVHRDIKPENILLDTKGRVKIADFGLGKLLNRPEDTRLSGPQQVMGTLHYMAPEQWEKPSAVDHRADIYSLGVVFYELLTGELPLGRFSLPSQKATIDVRIDEIVLRTLEKEPNRRYQHASEIKTDVDRITAESVDQLSFEEINAALHGVPQRMKELKSLRDRLTRRSVTLWMDDYRKKHPEAFQPWSRRKKIAVTIIGLLCVVTFIISSSVLAFEKRNEPVLLNNDLVLLLIFFTSMLDIYFLRRFPRWKSIAERASLSNTRLGCWVMLAALIAFVGLSVGGRIARNGAVIAIANSILLLLVMVPLIWRLLAWLLGLHSPPPINKPTK